MPKNGHFTTLLSNMLQFLITLTVYIFPFILLEFSMFQLVSLSYCHAHPRKVQLLCYSPFRWLKSIKPPSFRRELYHPFSKTMFSGPLIILVLFAEHFPISLVLRSPVLDTTLLIFLAMAQQRMNHLPQLAGNTSPIRMLASFACKHTLLACSQPAVD